MRKVREILRLGLKCGMGYRRIGRSCSTSHSTVSEYLKRVKTKGLTYDEIENMDDLQLERLLKNGLPEKSSQSREQPDWKREQPDWKVVHQELKKKGVTLQLLWEEYKQIHPDGYQSTQFYELYSRWKKKLHVTMRQTHKAGEKLFVDYAGQTVPVVDPNTGQVKDAQIFVAVLGASN